MQLKNKIPAQWFARPLGGLLAALILGLNLMAASPSLHKLIHADADQAQHQCAVTLFAHGQVDAADIAVAIPVPAAAAEFSPSVPVSILCVTTENLPPGRAPPLASHNS